MLDTALRSRLDGPLDRAAAPLDRLGIAPNHVTALGLVVGVLACVAIADGRWWLGLGLWLANRLADGLDGPLARRQGPTDLGGFFDIIADFAVYSGVVVAIGIAVPEARLAGMVVLLTYYLSGSSFLAFSSLAAKRRLEGDGRSLTFPPGLAEGTETIAAYVIILAFPEAAETLLWIWAAIVGVTVLQRFVYIVALLRD